MRPRKRLNTFLLVVVSLGVLLWSSLWTSASWAAGTLVNGSFDRYQPALENGRPRVWHGYPERIASGWQVTKLQGGSDLHTMDSYTLALFLARVLGKSFSNVFADSYLSQGLASANSFDIVLFQTVPVQAGQAYAVGASVATYWMGVDGPRDDGQVFKRVGVDPQGGSSPTSASVVWADWQSLDKQWVPLNVNALASGRQMTVFIQIQNRGGPLPDGEVTIGYVDSVYLEPTSLPSTPTLTTTPSPTPTPTVIPPSTPVATPTATLLFPTPSPTISPMPWPTPTVFPPPGPVPSPTPTPLSPAVPYFKLKTVRMLSIVENGGCLGNHHVFLSVLDSEGRPLLGAVMGDPPANNFRVTSGQKYEPFFDWGTKLAEVSLFNSGTRLRVMESPAGKMAISEQTPLLSTNTWEIPVTWLVKAGYCDSEQECGGLLCQGHYSYWVVFQQANP